MKIYTRQGDSGETGLLGGARVLKSHCCVEALGALDELNASVGMVRSMGTAPDIDVVLESVQNSLFDIGALVATPSDTAPAVRERLQPVSSEQVSFLETSIDRYESELQPLQWFILPGGCPSAAAVHFARAVCRRAERSLVRLCEDGSDLAVPLAYLNRLSDLLFVMARVANHRNGVADVRWAGSDGRA